MKDSDKQLLKEHDWIIECVSPPEIRHIDGSLATGRAVQAVIFDILTEEEWDDDDEDEDTDPFDVDEFNEFWNN